MCSKIVSGILSLFSKLLVVIFFRFSTERWRGRSEKALQKCNSVSGAPGRLGSKSPGASEDDDDIQIDEEFLESLKNTWFYNDNKMPKQMFIQIGRVLGDFSPGC